MTDWGTDQYGRGALKPNWSLIEHFMPYVEGVLTKKYEYVRAIGDKVQIRHWAGPTEYIYGPVSNSEVQSFGFDEAQTYLSAHISAVNNPPPPEDDPAPAQPDFYTFTLTFWTPIPSSLEMPILERLVAHEKAFGWRFWNLTISGDTITVGATKEGSVTVAVIIASIAAVLVAIAGLFIVRSYTARVESQNLVQRELSEERQGIDETIQFITQSDLPPEEKSRLIDELLEYKQDIPLPTPDGSPTEDIKQLMVYAVGAALVIALIKN